jgi:hypothetical protein
MNRKKKLIGLGLLLIVLVLIGTACDGNGDLPTPPPLPEDVDSLVTLAKFDLSLKTGADIEKITTESVEKTEFPDASLGVPEPGVDYAAVITPGYIIIIKYEGKSYEYRASGERVVAVPETE